MITYRLIEKNNKILSKMITEVNTLLKKRELTDQEEELVELLKQTKLKFIECSSRSTDGLINELESITMKLSSEDNVHSIQIGKIIIAEIIDGIIYLRPYEDIDYILNVWKKSGRLVSGKRINIDGFYYGLTEEYLVNSKTRELIFNLNALEGSINIDNNFKKNVNGRTIVVKAGDDYDQE